MEVVWLVGKTWKLIPTPEVSIPGGGISVALIKIEQETMSVSRFIGEI